LKSLKSYYAQNPLIVILIVALLVRIVCVLFAKGFGMYDDHFLIIENSRSWLSGHNYGGWLPIYGNNGANPQGHSLLYVVVSYCIFWVLSLLGVTELNSQMYFVRLFLALFSLLSVYFGYKITKYETKNINSANAVGWLLALYWFFPWLSVRNLVEVVCVPFLLLGLWLYICSKESKKPLLLICASALVMSIGMGIRLQAVFFVGGFGLALLIKKEWKQAMVFALTFC